MTITIENVEYDCDVCWTEYAEKAEVHFDPVYRQEMVRHVPDRAWPTHIMATGLRHWEFDTFVNDPDAFFDSTFVVETLEGRYSCKMRRLDWKTPDTKHDPTRCDVEFVIMKVIK